MGTGSFGGGGVETVNERHRLGLHIIEWAKYIF